MFHECLTLFYLYIIFQRSSKIIIYKCVYRVQEIWSTLLFNKTDFFLSQTWNSTAAREAVPIDGISGRRGCRGNLHDRSMIGNDQDFREESWRGIISARFDIAVEASGNEPSASDRGEVARRMIRTKGPVSPSPGDLAINPRSSVLSRFPRRSEIGPFAAVQFAT